MHALGKGEMNQITHTNNSVLISLCYQLSEHIQTIQKALKSSDHDFLKRCIYNSKILREGDVKHGNTTISRKDTKKKKGIQHTNRPRSVGNGEGTRLKHKQNLRRMP